MKRPSPLPSAVAFTAVLAGSLTDQVELSSHTLDGIADPGIRIVAAEKVVAYATGVAVMSSHRIRSL